jgi:hypothetical protein
MINYLKTILNQRRKIKMNKSQILQGTKKAFVFSFFILAVNYFSQAQNQDVIIIDAYKPSISDAFKINNNPKIKDTVVEKLDLKYQVSPKLYPTSFSVDPIKAAKMIGQPLTKLYKAYAKAGFGSKLTPLAEFYFGNLRSTDQSIGVYFKHLSSFGKIKDYAFPGFSDNEAGAFARKFYKQHMLSGEIDYNRNVVHYYGFYPSDFPTIPNIKNNKDTIRQRFAKVGGQVKFKSTYKDTMMLHHSLGIKYFNLSDLYDAREDNFNFNGTVDKRLNIIGKSFKDQGLGLLADMDYFNDVNKIDTSSGAVIRIEPHLSATYSNILKFYLGINASFQTGEESKTHLYPNANININIYNDIFILYGGITGELKKNNLIALSEENPFINTSLPLAFSNTKSKAYGGFKGSLSSYLSFNACISKSKIYDMPLFVNDTSSVILNRFTIVYDTVGVFNSHAEITYQKTEKIKLMLISNFYQYYTTNELYAWNKPNMDVKFSLYYNLKNKIIFRTDIFALSRSDAKQIVPGTVPKIESIDMEGAVDFNIGLEYKYTKILSGFLNLNNIGAVRYKRWYNYPSYGFNVIAGVTYAF